MASEVGIANAALQLIKSSKQITSITQGTKEANAVEVIYEELRDACLEMHVWNFATKRVKLAQLTDTPTFGWDYSYQLPADNLRIISVHPSTSVHSSVPYRIEGQTLSADAENIYLKYIARITDPNQMTATFRLALSKLLASRLAVTLAQSTSLSKEMYEQFVGEDMPTAKGADSVQEYVQMLPESHWVGVRDGYHEYPEPGEVSS